MLNNFFFFFENRTVYEITVEKCGGDREATNDVTIWRMRVPCWITKAICTYAHAHAHEFGYPPVHALACAHRPICDTYCFFTATMVSRTHLIVTLYVHCLSCYFSTINSEYKRTSIYRLSTY